MAGPFTDDILNGPPPPPSDFGFSGGSNEGHGARRRTSLIGLYFLLVSSTMVFLALLAALLMRRDIGQDWVSIPKPHLLWWNTVALVASSVFIERARRALVVPDRTAFNKWWTAATILGIWFLVGQALAWKELKDAGLFIASTPSASFFYILTATHAAHLIGALAAVSYVDVQALRFRLGPAKRTIIEVSAIFWHFLDVMWLCLMAVIYLWT